VSGVVGLQDDYLPIGFLAGFCCGLAEPGPGAAVGFPVGGMPFFGSF
jgi:hypothetical protein